MLKIRSALLSLVFAFSFTSAIASNESTEFNGDEESTKTTKRNAPPKVSFSEDVGVALLKEYQRHFLMYKTALSNHWKMTIIHYYAMQNLEISPETLTRTKGFFVNHDVMTPLSVIARCLANLSKKKVSEKDLDHFITRSFEVSENYLLYCDVLDFSRSISTTTHSNSGRSSKRSHSLDEIFLEATEFYRTDFPLLGSDPIEPPSSAFLVPANPETFLNDLIEIVATTEKLDKKDVLRDFESFKKKRMESREEAIRRAALKSFLGEDSTATIPTSPTEKELEVFLINEKLSFWKRQLALTSQSERFTISYPFILAGQLKDQEKLDEIPERTLKEGTLVQFNNGHIQQGAKNLTTDFESSDLESEDPIWVLGPKGEMYIADETLDLTEENGQRIKVHHSHFIQKEGVGQPVACAGHVRMKSGKIAWISNGSGHYMPLKIQLLLAVRYLHLQHNVISPNVVIGSEVSPNGGLSLRECLMITDHLLLGGKMLKGMSSRSSLGRSISPDERKTMN